MTLPTSVRALAAYLPSWLEYQRDLARIPGVQVAVRVHGELLASFALGVANEATGEPLTPAHLFRIASHSKTFTATGVFQLIEDGALRLDDPAGRWIPELHGSPAAGLTVRELLGHQSGINRDGADSDYWQQTHPFPDRDALIALCRADAVFAPNEHFKYSNMGYSLLGLILKRRPDSRTRTSWPPVSPDRSACATSGRNSRWRANRNSQPGTADASPGTTLGACCRPPTRAPWRPPPASTARPRT